MSVWVCVDCAWSPPQNRFGVVVYILSNGIRHDWEEGESYVWRMIGKIIQRYLAVMSGQQPYPDGKPPRST